MDEEDVERAVREWAENALMAVAQAGIPDNLHQDVRRELDQQVRQRGRWVNLRLYGDEDARNGYPRIDNPIVSYLLLLGQEQLALGVDALLVIATTVAAAWREGHIEGFDRGQREARGQDQ